MRKLIKTRKINGELTIGDAFIFDNVRGEYQYDVFSNKEMNGYFEVPNIPAELMNDLDKNEYFKFIGDGILMEGRIYKMSIIFGNPDKIGFKLNEVTEQVKWNNELPKILTISYLIPYVNALARDIRSSWGFYDDYIIKFSSDEYKLSINNIDIRFNEIANLVKHERPDFILHRQLFPVIKVNLMENDDFYNHLDELKDLMDNVMHVLSLLLYHRLNCFGYEASVLDENNKLIQTVNHRFKGKKSGIDCFLEDKLEFNKYFTSANLARVIESYILLNDDDKQKFNRIIYSYLTIKELKIFEPKFKDTFFALEAISKIIFKPEKHISPEELIEEACKIASIDLKTIGFLPSTNSNKLKWLISEYRNDLTHFNCDIDFDFQELINEHYKMMKLLRSLMIYYLVPELKDFPYPGDKLKEE